MSFCPVDGHKSVWVWVTVWACCAGQVAHVSPPFSESYDGMDDQAVVDEVGPCCETALAVDSGNTQILALLRP
jgi:hypothetical protein